MAANGYFPLVLTCATKRSGCSPCAVTQRCGTSSRSWCGTNRFEPQVACSLAARRGPNCTRTASAPAPLRPDQAVLGGRALYAQNESRGQVLLKRPDIVAILAAELSSPLRSHRSPTLAGSTLAPPSRSAPCCS